MKKEILINNIENLTSKEKELLETLFSSKEELDLAYLINDIKQNLKETKNKEAHNKLLKKLTEFNKGINQEVEKWWRQAENDLEKARDNLKTNHPDGAAFFAQQSVEKALKALLIKKKGQFPKIHDIVALSRMANLPDDITKKCKIINPYYTETRYPDFSEKIPAESFSKEEIMEIIRLSRDVLSWIKKFLT